MKKLRFLLFLFCVSSAVSAYSQVEEQVILVTTDYGNMKIKLYNETPQHRDNMLKLIKEGFYDDLLFHRVIKDFMIQGGDPDSKNTQPEQRLGNGGPGYQIPAEIKTGLIHKKGVLAAAREGDRVNPEKKSSGSQFYIVQGAIYTIDQMNMMEEKMNMRKKQQIIAAYLNKPENKDLKRNADSLYNNKLVAEVQTLFVVLEEKTKDEYNKSEPFKFTDQQREVYTTVGGTPHLDGAYTVFGEVIFGLDVIDKIGAVETNNYDRPITDVHMTMKIIK